MTFLAFDHGHRAGLTADLTAPIGKHPLTNLDQRTVIKQKRPIARLQLRGSLTVPHALQFIVVFPAAGCYIS
jgi:hypothetical protein